MGMNLKNDATGMKIPTRVHFVRAAHLAFGSPPLVWTKLKIRTITLTDQSLTANQLSLSGMTGDVAVRILANSEITYITERLTDEQLVEMSKGVFPQKTPNKGG